MIYMRLQNSQGSDLVIYSAKSSYDIVATKYPVNHFTQILRISPTYLNEGRVKRLLLQYKQLI